MFGSLRIKREAGLCAPQNETGSKRETSVIGVNVDHWAKRMIVNVKNAILHPNSRRRVNTVRAL